MTEQLKKAARSAYSIKMSNSEAMKKSTIFIPYINVSCLANSIFSTAEGEHKSSFRPDILQKGKTNWQDGDIILLRSWIYIWLLRDEVQPNSPKMTLRNHINTSSPYVYSTNLTERTVDLSTTPGGYNIPYCSSTVMDTLICKVKNGFLYTVSPVDEVEVLIGEYVPVIYLNKDENNKYPAIDTVKILMDAEYIGTEQADGSIVYLA